MRSIPYATALILTALLLVSYVGPATYQGPVGIPILQDVDEQSLASGRSTTPEVFLSSGGTSTHDEFSGSIEAADNGYFVGGDFNSSAQTITFGTQSLQATSPFTNGNEFYLASADDSGSWNFLVGADHSQGGVTFLSDVDSNAGMPYVAGAMFGPVSFGQTTLSTNVIDGFIASADPSGSWMWATAFQTLANSSTDTSSPQAMAVDQFGDVVVAGYFSGETDFGGTIINVSNQEMFIAKLDGMNGALKWVLSGGGIGAQSVTDVIIDGNGDIHVAGLTQNNVLFGTTSYNTVGTQDSFILKISSGGSFQGITGYGIANQAVTVSNLALDSNGNLYVGGSFEGTMAKNGWSITANKGGSDLFFIKEGTTPSNQWAATGGSSSGDSLSGMEITSRGEIIFSSFFVDGTFSGGTKSVTGTSSSWQPSLDADVLVGGLSGSGGWAWLDVTGSTSLEVGWDLAVNSTDIATVIGSFAGPSPATITKDSTTVTSTGGWDVFVWAMDPSKKTDSDADGIPDVSDNCPNVVNPGQGNTDGDGQGDACDSDDDNDGITDNSPDDCPRGGQANWASTQDFDLPANSSDWDRDGCQDSSEDSDMDNDGISNDDDSCPRSAYQPPRPTWQSDSITDVDGDGCRDADEDGDDDGDGFEDVSDDCPTTVGTSTLGEEGCLDSDGDGWSDNFDDCPNQAGNSTLGGKNACPDQDGDGWADDDDAFVNEPSQWSDSDGDGYGDNPEGITPDDCPSVSGTSTLDRMGCLDSDGDGYSDTDSMWSAEDGGDAFREDPTQWSDFDEDGFGDNWGNQTWDDRNPSWPGEYRADIIAQDACPTQAGTSWQNGMTGCPDQDGDGWYNLQDAFPNEPTQWADGDGDGYGDNPTGVDADACPLLAGTSTEDRLGCKDGDGDGYSDPDPDRNWFPGNGADAFMADPTQWSDQDLDFYGDNPEGQNPDACPTLLGTSTVDRFGCLDSDGDGISDADSTWTMENGADACPLAYGNSTMDRIGCVDTDGDGYSDETNDWGLDLGADAYPKDPTRWILEPQDEESLMASSTTLIGGGIGLVVVLAGIGILMRRRKTDEPKGWDQAAPVAMPDFNAQPGMYGQPPTQTYAQPVAQYNPAQSVAQPAAGTQPVAVQPGPAVQPDPARDYYNSLLAQGYPPADAMRYTQQYYGHFQG